MVSLSDLGSLVLASAVVMGSPGPSTMSVTAVGAAFGWRGSLGYLGGLILGTSAVLLAVATGIVAMLLSIPRLAPVLLGASAVYIFHLAYRIATAPPLSRQTLPSATPTLTGGFLLAVANPKAYAAIAAVYAGTSLRLGTHAAEALIKTAVLAVMIVFIHVTWLLAGTSLSRVLHDPVLGRIANIVFAAILVAATVFTLLDR